MAQPVIVAATRSPIGRARKGSLVTMRPDDLAEQVVRAALASVPEVEPAMVDDLFMGCGLPGGEQGFNVGRVTAVLAGLVDVPASTVTRYCASSLETIRTAAHAVRAGEGEVFVAAGVECVSRYDRGTSNSWPDTRNPRFAEAERRSAERAEGGGTPWRPAEGLPDVYIAMGQTAENVAEIEGVSREEMDAFALRSQQRAVAAQRRGHFAAEITPVTLPGGGVVDTDDGPRPDTDLEKLAALQPVFRPDGRVTAGNSCPLNDGAAAVVVMAEDRARDLGISPLARILASGACGLDPEIMGLGPVEAGRRALARAGMKIDDLDLVEINEAFAAQVIPSMRHLGIDEDRLNVNGGAIALGHPFGMTGARLTTTLLNNLRGVDATLGMVALCVGGGQGMALIVERLS